MSKTTKRKDPGKSKVVVRGPAASDTKKPVWSFERIDRGGEYAFDINDNDFQHKKFLDKLISYSSMTWAEIKKQTHDNSKSKNHYLNYDGLSAEAKSRFEKYYKYDDIDAIFSFAFENLWRIVGLLYDEKFYIIWNDKNHKVYPVDNK